MYIYIGIHNTAILPLNYFSINDTIAIIHLNYKKMANTKGRINVSQNPVEVLNLSAKVYAKHLEDGANSPLNVLPDFDWAKIGPTIPMALAKHNEAEVHKAKMEAAYRERDLLIPPIDEIMKASKNLLKALNSKNPKRLAEWGFDVDDTSRKAKVTTP
jgi:hypothetical protein